MKEILNQIESYLEALVEGSTLKIFGSQDIEKKLIRQFLDAMGETIQTDRRGNLLAPHNFALKVPADYLEEIRSNQRLLDKLSQNLYNSAQKAGVQFNNNIVISVFPDKNLPIGSFSVQAIWKEEALSETAPSNISTGALLVAANHPRAFLIVGGAQIFTIDNKIVNIGRQLKNDLVVNDPRVSRKHAQIREVKGRHIIFDLDSSGGTFVNNIPSDQTALHPGDVISLAGVPLVYGHDTITPIADTEEYNPPAQDQYTDASTTTRTYAPGEDSFPTE
jgi:hypothetical protein